MRNRLLIKLSVAAVGAATLAGPAGAHKPLPNDNNGNPHTNNVVNNNTPSNNNNSNSNNGSTVTIVSCTSLTSGCRFSGNINTSTNTTDASSYINVENLYDASYNPGISLTPLAELSGNGTSGGITLTVNSGGTGGAFDVAPGIDLDYYAVKAGDYFMLYKYTGGAIGNWTTNGITVGNGQTPALSHIIFFGGQNALPEPATWAMMLFGFGAAGIGLRRQRRSLEKLQTA